MKFIGMQVTATLSGYFLHQRAFAQDLLKQWGMDSCRCADTPGDKAETEHAKNSRNAVGFDYWPMDGGGSAPPAAGRSKIDTCPEAAPDPATVVKAQRLAGSLQWLTSRSRPDIAYTVSRIASVATTAPEWALQMGMRLLRYVRQTVDYGILYTPFSNKAKEGDLKTYSDASWGPDGGDTSHLGAIVFWAGCAVAWRSCRAALAATSSCECELQAASLGFILGSGVQSLLESVGISVAHQLAIDNTAAIAILDGRTTWRTRHLAMRANALRDHVRLGFAVVQYVQTGEQLADCLTKHTLADVYHRLMRR